MDEEQRQRRNFQQSTYGRDYAPTSQSRNTDEAAQMRGLAGNGGMDALRQSQSQSARTGTASNLSGGAVGGYNYTQSQQYAPQQLSEGSYQYQPVYQQPPQQQQQRQLGEYSQYGAQIAYGAPPPMPAAQAQFTQYQQRQPAASSDPLGQQFSVPQYYQQTPGTVTTSQLAPSQYSTAQFQTPAAFDPTNDLSRSTLASPYPTVEPETSQLVTTESTDIGQKPSPAQEEQPDDRFEVFNHRYQRTLRETNENTSRGRLVEAGESLLELSGLLLGNVESLGLNKDDQKLHKERLKLWKDFNYCWLAFLTRQLDDSRRVSMTGQALPAGQGVLAKAALQMLGDELTRMCDDLEKSGLVDYEMGVWEEEIIDMLLECRKVAAGGNAGVPTSPNASRQSSKQTSSKR